MWGKGGQAAAWGGAGGDWGGGAKGGGWGGGAKGGGAKGGGDKGWGAPDPWMMMMMKAKAKGKGNSKGWGGFEAAVAEAWGIEGLTEALQASLAVVEGQDDSLNVADLVTKMESKIHKVVTKFSKDERASQRGTDSQAKVLIEEYMAELMAALHTICWEKPWFSLVDFSAPLLVTTLHTFKQSKIFTRTLAPDIAAYVEAGIFKWAEEDRIQKVMWDAIETCGVKESHRKKASKHLQAAYDEAHLNAPYGSSDNADAGLAMLMDFVIGWMKEFVGRAWDVLENGIDAGCSHDQQVLFVTNLFQTLTDPNTAAVPYEIAAVLQALPSNPWVFVAVTTEAVFKQVALEGATGGGGGKKRKK